MCPSLLVYCNVLFVYLHIFLCLRTALSFVHLYVDIDVAHTVFWQCHSCCVIFVRFFIDVQLCNRSKMRHACPEFILEFDRGFLFSEHSSVILHQWVSALRTHCLVTLHLGLLQNMNSICIHLPLLKSWFCAALWKLLCILYKCIC